MLFLSFCFFFSCGLCLSTQHYQLWPCVSLALVQETIYCLKKKNVTRTLSWCKPGLLSGLANVILCSKLVSAYMLVKAEESTARNQRLLIIRVLNTSGSQQQQQQQQGCVWPQHGRERSIVGHRGLLLNQALMAFWIVNERFEMAGVCKTRTLGIFHHFHTPVYPGDLWISGALFPSGWFIWETTFGKYKKNYASAESDQ